MGKFVDVYKQVNLSSKILKFYQVSRSLLIKIGHQFITLIENVML